METIVSKNILKESISNLNNEEVLTVHIIPHMSSSYWGKSKMVFMGENRKIQIDNNKIIIRNNIKGEEDGEYVEIDLGDKGYSEVQRIVRGDKLIRGTYKECFGTYKECFELIHNDFSVHVIITMRHQR